MGKFINGINGPIRGKVGTIIGSSWKGIPYLKVARKTRTKKASEEEKANRDKFAKAHEWLQPIINFLREGFRGYTPTVEGYNAAKSHLLRNAFEKIEGKDVLNPTLAKVSAGDLPMSGNMTVALTSPGTLEFTWDTVIPDESSYRDQVMLLAYDFEHNSVSRDNAGDFRGYGKATLPIESKPGFTYHVYAAFVAVDRSRQSDSVYLGTITT